MHAKRQRRVRASSWIWLAVSVIAIAFAVLIGMTIGRRRAAAGAEIEVVEDQGKTNRMKVIRLVRRRVEDRMELPAVIEPFAVAELAAEKGGRIVEITVEKGDAVALDDLLLRVDRRLWEAQVEQARIEFREVDREWTRWVALQESGAVSASDFDAVKTRRALAETALTQAQVHLSQCDVRSPMQGVINARYVERGEYLAEGQAVFQVVDVTRLKLEMDVPERVVGAMDIGKTVTFSVPAADTNEYTGHVSFVAAMASPGSKSFRTEITVDNPVARLRPGMIARVAFVRRILDEALVVPLAAVVPRKGEYVLFTVKNGVAVRHVVTIDSMTGESAVLRSGVEAGADVVVAGQRTLRDGTPIDAVDRDER